MYPNISSRWYIFIQRWKYSCNSDTHTKNLDLLKINNTNRRGQREFRLKIAEESDKNWIKLNVKVNKEINTKFHWKLLLRCLPWQNKMAHDIFAEGSCKRSSTFPSIILTTIHPRLFKPSPFADNFIYEPHPQTWYIYQRFSPSFFRPAELRVLALASFTPRNTTDNR